MKVDAKNKRYESQEPGCLLVLQDVCYSLESIQNIDKFVYSFKQMFIKKKIITFS